MLSVSSKKLLLSASSAIAMVALSQNAIAQDTSIDDNEVDEIIATGIRASVAKSIDDKRRAKQIVDTINAEDIGKSTDQNIAEALNRISGVSITEQEGEGAFISIRGASPDQTIVTLNGAAQGTTEFSQAVNLSSFSSDILGKIEVIKTPSADDEEGSLGGLVNLVTRKPLEINKDIRTITAQGRFNDQSGGGKLFNKPLGVEDYKLSGTVSQKFMDDKFGIIVSAVDETNSLRQDFTAGREWDANRSFNGQDLDGNVYQSDNYTDPSLWGIAARQTAYGVREGQRDRQALDFAAQWQPYDATSITANLNFARQQVENTMHESIVRNNDQSRDPNFNNVGSPYPSAFAFINGAPTPFQDPSDWMILDPETRTWVRTLRRFQPADINASSDKYENKNFTGSLDFEQELFGKLTLNAGGSYQKSEQIPDQRVFVNLQSARENPVFLRFNLSPSELEPAGVDCRTGVCVPVTGSTPINLGSIIDQPTGAEISSFAANGIVGTIGQPITTRNDDNVSLTGNNPDDILAKSVGIVNQTLTAVEDTNEVLYLDADYDLDKFGLTTFEFGGKYTKREKFVDNQSGNVTNRNAAASIVNPLTGQPILVSNALDQTPVLPFAVNIAPNGFLSGIGLSGNSISDGFTSVDPVGIFNLIRADEGIAIDIDDTETRSASFENMALYAKANFEFLDERLTGDIGLRWVKTEVETSGSAGIRAFNESFGRNQRIYDLRNLRSLMNASQPACPAIPFDPNGDVSFGDAARYARVDGLGYDTNGTADFSDDTSLPNSLPCHEPFLLDVNNLRDLGFFPQDLRRYNNLFWTNNDIFSGGDLSAQGSNNTIRTFGTAGSHEYDVFLPSINLNYALNDEMIVRLAASQTMTRPEIDLIRPGFNVGETGWGNPATRVNNINLFNTTLDPLKSKNFDASFEWYFDKDALFSIGLFYKDITDLIETEQQEVYLRDVKTEVQNGEEVSFEGLLLDESSITIDNCYAEILGEWQYGYNPGYVENMLYSDEPEFLCAQFRATQPRNAAGADIKGLELQYSQSYTFLPGIFSGLGLSANYTYQDSSFAQDTSDLVAGVELPRFQINRTPEHSYNVTAYWQQDGHQLRLAYGGSSDVLLQRNFAKGALWQDGRETLDFSGAYKVNDYVTFTFDATNLLDQSYRTYFTSRTVRLPETATGGGTDLVAFDEGNPISGDAYQGRTVNEYNIGRNFRAAVRVTF